MEHNTKTIRSILATGRELHGRLTVLNKGRRRDVDALTQSIRNMMSASGPGSAGVLEIYEIFLLSLPPTTGGSLDPVASICAIDKAMVKLLRTYRNATEPVRAFGEAQDAVAARMPTYRAEEPPLSASTRVGMLTSALIARAGVMGLDEDVAARRYDRLGSSDFS